MNFIAKRSAAFVSALVMCAAAFGHYPVCRQTADAKAPSVRDFADSVLPNLPAQPDSVFESLFYNKQTHKLLRDGTAVPGDSFSGFRVINGELRIAASQTVRSGEKADGAYLTLDEAVPLIGLETHETKDGIYVSDPFRSGTLIVKTDDLPDTMGASEIGEGWDDLHVLQYQTAADAYAAYQAFQADNDVIYAEPNRVYHICEMQEASSDYAFPSDNWGWRAIGADGFLTTYEERAASAPDVVAAVIDTGLYAGHDWFQGRIADGGTAFINENNSSFEDLHGHGTHCAGIICGMTPDNVKILPLKALNAIGYGESLGIYCAMMYAAEQNADVVSMSLGGDGCSPMFEEAVRRLREKQIPCVVAAGNDTDDARYYAPANIPDAFTVSSVSQATDNEMSPDYFERDIEVRGYAPSSFSNYGKGIDFAAPGDSINSAGMGASDDIVGMSGTSMATPHVAGCVANILTVQNDYTVDDVYECLRVNCRDLGDTGFDEKYGWGMVSIGSLDFSQSDLPCPRISQNSGTFSHVFNVTLASPEPDAEIRYTLDGTIPEADTGILYQGEDITIDNTTELCAVTVKDGERSTCARRRYIFYLDPPTASPEPGDYYDSPLSVQLATPNGAEIYYTLDGSDPDKTNGFRYKAPIQIERSTLLKASCVVGNYVSEPGIFCYTIDDVPCKGVFDAENGVLKHYYGNDVNLDLTDYFDEGELTEIGDGAFAGSERLENLILPKSVTTLGKYAFSECSRLTAIHAAGVETVEPYCFNMCMNLITADLPALKRIEAHGFENALGEAEQVFPVDVQIEEIGDHGFESSNLVYADFPYLKKIGKSAFGYCYCLKSVKLPETITVLPEMSFFMCMEMVSFDVPGITEIGDYALYLGMEWQSHLETCTIDFSKVTSIGTEALSIFKRPEIMEHVSFDSLTHIGANAFGYFSAKELCLPVLKDIPAYAFWNTECSIVYLEQAEHLQKNALTLNPAWGKHITFVFGDQISPIQQNPLVSGSEALTVAAPAGSPMQMFADNANIPFCAIPDIFIPSELNTVQQYDIVSLKDCIPLAFGAKLTFTALDTAYASGYDAPAQPIFADYTGEQVMLDTSVPGTVTIRIDLTDESGTVLTSKTQDITIEPAESLDLLTKEDVVVLDWSKGTVYEEEPESVFSLPDICAYSKFLFRPETGGTYYFVPESSDFSLFIHNSRNELIAQIAARPDYEEIVDFEPVELNAGEIYRITAETRTETILDERFTGVLISRQKPTTSVQSGCGIAPYQFIVEKGKPFTPEITVTGYSDFDWETGYPTLKENVDYRIERLKYGESEKIFVFGMGSFFGTYKIPVYAYEDITIGDTFELPEMYPGEQLVYRIKNVEENGQHAFCLDLSDAYLNAFAAGEIDGDPVEFMAIGELRDSEFTYVSSDISSYYLFDENIYNLSSGEDYYFLVEYYPMNHNKRIAHVPAGKYTLSAHKADLSKWITKCDVGFRESVPYTGTKHDHLCTITDQDGNALEEGRDFLTYVRNTVLPGESDIIVKCIGDYFGCCSGVFTIKSPDPKDERYAAKPIRINEPFTVGETCGFFELNTDSTCSCTLRKTGSSDPDAKYIYSVQAYSEDTLSWEAICSGNQSDRECVINLLPGTYRVYISQEAEEQEFILDALQSTAGIGLADVRTEPLYYTGETLSPEITLTYEGKILTEGRDYMLIYPDEPILACGIYCITAAGIGDFSSERIIRIVVKDREKPVHQTAQDGENTVAVTAPGHAVYLEWTPEHSRYGIAMNGLPVTSLVICDAEENTDLISLSGTGYLSDTFDVVPGRTYLICAAYRNPELTGEIRFDLVPDCTDLNSLTVEGTSQIVFTACGAVPEITVRNGETVLQQGTDYDTYFCGGNNEPGHAVLTLTGKGNYIGCLTYDFYLSPALDADTFDQDETTITMTVNEAEHPLVQRSGDTEQFVFEAPADGVYTIARPDPQKEGIAVFVYGADQELLPPDTKTVAMKAGQKLRFFAVSEHLEDYLNRDYQYTLAVYNSTQTYELTADDCVYQIRDGAAYLDQYHGNHTGIQLPETVYDPDQDVNIPVMGCTAELIAEIGSSKTIYIGNAGGFLMPEGGCYAVPDPQTGIPGDITGDGVTDANDWLTLTRCLAECPGMLLHESAIAAGDINGDGCLDLPDADALWQMISETQL